MVSSSVKHRRHTFPKLWRGVQVRCPTYDGCRKRTKVGVGDGGVKCLPILRGGVQVEAGERGGAERGQISRCFSCAGDRVALGRGCC